MRTTKVTVTCDICANNQNDCSVTEKKIPVIFTTNQTDGHSCTPYLTSNTLDICERCEETIMKGKIPFGQGAQGYNKYHFGSKA